MGAGFFEKARADSETWDLGLVMNEGKLFELSPPAAYVVVGLIKLAKPRFPLPFTYVVENRRRHSISDLTEKERGRKVLRKSRTRQLTYGSGAEPLRRGLGQHLYNSQSSIGGGQDGDELRLV
ncbi:hypothetical protein RND71_008020 [Anisodus tanguticus]|uniref:Uncharacterized protein n=1 Tax=Anisodus tanguticus TaxID=243964 RepID=A0AAE1SQ24_9SOLA|nr:hypothetical protein RND71_008020 [Anisodus tanguticus]